MNLLVVTVNEKQIKSTQVKNKNIGPFSDKNGVKV